MAPKISPKKTWEGLAGSLVFGIAAGVGTAVFGLKVPFWVGIVLGVALVAVGTCGDLVESMIKTRHRDQGHELVPARARGSHGSTGFAACLPPR